MMSSLIDEIQQGFATKRPILYLRSPEERRVIDAIIGIVGNNHVITWSCTQGLEGQGEETTDPVAAIQHIIEAKTSGYYVFKDLSVFMDDPKVIRALRDAYDTMKGQADSRIIILSPIGVVPEILRRDILSMDLPLPETSQLMEEVERTLKQYTSQSVPVDILNSIALSLGGLSADDAEFVIHSALGDGPEKLSKQQLLAAIHSAKQSLASRTGFLEYVPNQLTIDQVGGLSNFKNWLEDRDTVFNTQAIEKDIPIPRGILITGISGCGKSLCAKVIASTWDIPLYRLDMNLIFSDLHGSPEASFHTALKTIETVAPAVLWIDEIENGLGFEKNPDPIQSHIFSAFLTWMQEKPPLIFVAATANRIDYLPPEMIRKGRFDQVFFVDLPDKDERQELIDIHLRANGADPGEFKMTTLVAETEEWNGAEIEQVIIAARIHGHHQQREFTTEDVVHFARQLVPLSRTMKEQIKRMRDWAWNRATPASSGRGTDYSILEEIKGN